MIYIYMRARQAQPILPYLHEYILLAECSTLVQLLINAWGQYIFKLVMITDDLTNCSSVSVF